MLHWPISCTRDEKICRLPSEVWLDRSHLPDVLGLLTRPVCKSLNHAPAEGPSGTIFVWILFLTILTLSSALSKCQLDEWTQSEVCPCPVFLSANERTLLFTEAQVWTRSHTKVWMPAGLQACRFSQNQIPYPDADLPETILFIPEILL